MFGAQWPKIQDLCLETNYRILRSSPIAVLIGKATLSVFEERLRKEPSIELEKVALQLKVFEKDPFFYIVHKTEKSNNLYSTLIMEADFFIEPSSKRAYIRILSGTWLPILLLLRFFYRIPFLNVQQSRTPKGGNLYQTMRRRVPFGNPPNEE